MTHHAATEPDTATETDETAAAPSRPALVELAAAILIVGGALALLGAVSSVGRLPEGAEPFALLAVALGIGSVVVGVLVRLGRLWLLGVNYVAVLGFLDLLGAGGSPLALMLGAADVLVVVILLVRKPWFDAMGRWRASQPSPPRRLSP